MYVNSEVYTPRPLKVMQRYREVLQQLSVWLLYTTLMATGSVHMTSKAKLHGLQAVAKYASPLPGTGVLAQSGIN